METLPKAIWVPAAGEMNIYRGTPEEMVLEMAGQEDVSVRQALKALCYALASEQRVVMDLPWEESDARCSELFVMGLLVLGLGHPAPQA